MQTQNLLLLSVDGNGNNAAWMLVLAKEMAEKSHCDLFRQMFISFMLSSLFARLHLWEDIKNNINLGFTYARSNSLALFLFM